MAREDKLANGPAAAALVAAGIGSVALGLFTTLPEANTSVKEMLSFYSPVDPLSGKTTLAVIVWLLSWAILHGWWRNKELAFGKVFITTLALIALGIVSTFPPFFAVSSP